MLGARTASRVPSRQILIQGGRDRYNRQNGLRVVGGGDCPQLEQRACGAVSAVILQLEQGIYLDTGERVEWVRDNTDRLSRQV